MSFLRTFFFLVAIAAAATTTTTGGGLHVNYDPNLSSTPPSIEILGILKSLDIVGVRINNPTPKVIQTLSTAAIELHFSIPNNMVVAMAQNSSSVKTWLENHVLPFSRSSSPITLIAMGEDWNFPSRILITSMRSMRHFLEEFGLEDLRVTTSFTFAKVVGYSQSDLTNQFQDLKDPLFEFLREAEPTSPLLVNVYPFFLQRQSDGLSKFALFQSSDQKENLFNMMINCLCYALSRHQDGDIPLIVSTGWPSSARNWTYANRYLNGLLLYLQSEIMNQMVHEVYLEKLFDEPNEEGFDWGIIYANGSSKYFFNHAKSEEDSKSEEDDKRGDWLAKAICVLTPILLSISCYFGCRFKFRTESIELSGEISSEMSAEMSSVSDLQL